MEWSGSRVDGANRRLADSAGGRWSFTGRLCCTFGGTLLVLLQFFQKDSHGGLPSLPADEGLGVDLLLKSAFLFVHLRCLMQHLSNRGLDVHRFLLLTVNPCAVWRTRATLMGVYLSIFKVCFSFIYHYECFKALSYTFIYFLLLLLYCYFTSFYLDYSDRSAS